MRRCSHGLIHADNLFRFDRRASIPLADAFTLSLLQAHRIGAKRLGFVRPLARQHRLARGRCMRITGMTPLTYIRG
jgi:hypothetical protein